MKSTALLFGLWGAIVIGRAEPADEVIIQAMQLADAPNYSWTTTVSDDASFHTIEGRTQRAGFTWVRMPMLRAVAQKLGSSSGHLEAVYFGRDTFVLRAADGWVSMKEVPWGMPRPEFDSFALARGRPGGRMGTLGAPLPPVVRSRATPTFDDDELRLPGNIHLGLTPPHEELAMIVSTFTDLQIGSGVATGTLSDLGAALLLVRDGQTNVVPLAASGVFKLWFRDGHVVRYQLQLAGSLAVGRKTISVRTLTTTTLKDVGTTQVSVPDEARLKLER